MSAWDYWSRFQVAKLSDAEREALRQTITLGHFRDGDKLVAVCSHCYFGRIIDPFRLRRRLVRELRESPICSLEKRLRCSKCNAAGTSRFYYAAVEDPPGG